MPISYPEIRKFAGLFIQRNSFNVPDGALEVAENVVISQDDTIQKVRGTYKYYDPGSQIISNLTLFRNKLIAIFSDKMGYFDDVGTSPNETGSFVDLSAGWGGPPWGLFPWGLANAFTFTVTAPRKARTLQANDNLYVTSDQGVVKLEGLTSFVQPAGIPPAIDLEGVTYPDSGSGPILANPLEAPTPTGTRVGYRVIFGKRDANENLLLGAPSQRFYYTNEVFSVSSMTHVGTLETVTTTAPHQLSVGSVFTMTGSAHGDANGTFTVRNVLSATQFTFVAPTGGNSSVGTVSADRKVLLQVGVPSELDAASGYFCQIYRTSMSGAADESPPGDWALIDEITITQDHIDNQTLTYVDEVSEIFRAQNEVLYTNENSAEGEAQANYRPPLCGDVTYFKDHAIYANCATRHLLNLSVVTTDSGTTGDVLTFRLGSDALSDRNYIARVGYANSLTGAYDSTAIVSGNDIRITTATDHGYITGDSAYVAGYIGVGTVTEGLYSVTKISNTQFDLVNAAANANFTSSVTTNSGSANVTVATTSIYETGMRLSGTGIPAGAYIVSITNATTFVMSANATASGTVTATVTHVKFVSFWVDENLSGDKIFALSQIPSVIGADLALTAKGIVKAVNRDELSSIYAIYTSLENGVPGQFYVQGKGFVNTIYAKASSAGLANCFAPTLPTSFTSVGQVFSTNDLQPNVFFASKVLEPEAVPIANFFPVGTKNAAILRVVALRDSMIVIKEDGIFRVTGTGPQDYDVTILDNTVFCVAPDSVVVLNNFVYMLSNQGVVRVGENSVEIISRKIENVIAPILGQTNLIERTSGLGYESDRQYQLSTTLPNNPLRTVTYIYNYINDTWTTRTQIFKAATLGPNNTLYVVNDDNEIMKERKTQTRIDYCGQNYSASVNSVDPDAYGATITSVDAVPVVGDVLEKDEIFNRIISVTSLGANLYSLRFARLSLLQTGDAPILYKAYSSTFKNAPIHAGLIGRGKQFTQMQLHLRDNAVTYLTISFTNQQYGGSQQVLWDGVQLGGSAGWGFEGWGFFGWGQQDGIQNNYTTTPAPICRIYIPLFAQRTTFLQPVVVHSQAGEPIDIQAMSIAVRAYNERVSK